MATDESSLLTRAGNFSPFQHRLIKVAALAVFSVALLIPQQATLAADIILINGCSLSDAIQAANTDTAVGDCPAGSGADIITLSEMVELTAIADTTNGDNGLPSITSDITIDGNGLEIIRQSGGNYRIFHVGSTGSLTLQSVVVRGGTTTEGGGIYVAGGTVNIINSLVANNYADNFGGGIYIGSGTVNITGSTFSANRQDIYNAGTLTILGSALEGTNGEGVVGSALYNNANATIDNSRVNGIYNSGTLTINHTTLDGARNANGFVDNAGGGNLTLNFITMINPPSLGYVIPLINNAGTVSLNSSILFNTVTAECSGAGTFNGSNNLGTTNVCPGIIDNLPPGGVDIQPHIGLADTNNGGPTWTHAIPGTSSLAYNRLGDCAANDQRFVQRDTACDIGAYEFTGGTISSVVWEDLNGYGVRNRILNPGIDGVTVTLRDSGGNPIASQITANGGYYAFDDLSAGTYSVSITLPSGNQLTRQSSTMGGEGSDSDADPATGITDDIVVLANNVSTNRADFGLYVPVTITGIVYNDLNNNGVQDASEPGILDATVTASRINPSATYSMRSQIDGSYSFTGLLPGLYTITVTPPPAPPTGASALPDKMVMKVVASPALQTTPPITREIQLFSGEGADRSYDFGFAPTSPVNAVPITNVYITPTPTLNWSAVSWAAGYEIQVDDQNKFTSPEYRVEVGSESLPHEIATALPNGTYFWRIRAKRPDGTWGVWSTVDSFTVYVNE